MAATIRRTLDETLKLEAIHGYSILGDFEEVKERPSKVLRKD